MTRERILGFIGLAARAGKTVSGFEAVVSEVSKGRVDLLIISKDISRNTLEKLLRTDGLPDAFSFAGSDELGRATGRSPRTVIGIEDAGFAKRLTEMLEQYEEDDTLNE